MGADDGILHLHKLFSHPNIYTEQTEARPDRPEWSGVMFYHLSDGIGRVDQLGGKKRAAYANTTTMELNPAG